eukprot:TRINITY_DN50650_c0_g1_i1.p1 TRINITY_DN50650_c0_g1~~TRINITY_DN50650_c0_g1_i1.p1  ORF type:complete len:165 (-),score=28.96 TRINITY_DN50650_c0_g1_i1:217-711(-)
MMRAAAVLASVALANGEPCCKSCEEPMKKYYSVDVPHGFCGETCMDPKNFAIYKKFEANLTLVEEGTEHGPCATQFAPDGSKYTDYLQTVTHGVPHLLTSTLDLYAPTNMPKHDCCSSPLLQSLGCFGTGKSTKLSIRGTGPYCCPDGATEENPCGTASVSLVV